MLNLLRKTLTLTIVNKPHNTQTLGIFKLNKEYRNEFHLQ